MQKYRIKIELPFPDFNEAIRQCIKIVGEVESENVWDGKIDFDGVEFEHNYKRKEVTFVFIYHREHAEPPEADALEFIDVPFELIP